MRIIATACLASDLKSGDLFSTGDQDTWDDLSHDLFAVGQKVYIRTHNPCPPDQAAEPIFRLTITEVASKP